MIVLAMFLAAVVQAQPVTDQYCGEQNLQVSQGRVELSRKWEPRFSEGFEQGMERWRTENYENKLTLGVAEGGRTGQCLRISNKGATGDTAFEVASEAFPVAAGCEWRLSFAWRSNVSLSSLAGHQGHYLTQMEWRNDVGGVISVTPFVFGGGAKEWRQFTLTGTTPAGATTAWIRFGFDSPNIADREFLAIDDLRFEIRAQPAPFEDSGRMLSRPLKAAGIDTAVSWQAQTPEGTSLRIQVAAADSRDGGPGQWSDFVGPDGTGASFYTTPGTLPRTLWKRDWLRYQVILETRNPTLTPTLESVSLGGVTDGPWSGLDAQPPKLAERSATRTGDASAPITLRLADETGYDRSSMVLRLDGKDITSQLTWADGRYTYRPPEPLTTPPVDPSSSEWRVGNHAGNLTIERADGGMPQGWPYYHITREAGEVDTAFSLACPSLSVEPGAKYRVSYWSRHSQDLRGAMAGTGGYSGGVTWFDAAGAPVGTRTVFDFGPANPQWHQDSYELTAPPGALTEQIRFGFDTPNLFDGAFVDISGVQLVGPRPVRPDDRPNLHRLSLRVADFAGNVLSRDWYLLVREPLTRNVVTIREDGMTLIDGKPFFPIGLYAVWKKAFNNDSFDKAFSDLKAAGFNLAHTYTNTRGADFSEFLASAARNGIKLYISSGAGANCLDPETVLWDVCREESQPALLSWYLADDTASHVGSEDLRSLSEAIHDADPAHPTVQADGVGAASGSRYAAFVNSTDGFLPELYPIRDDTDRGVPQIITDMKTVCKDLDRAGTRQRTIWAIVQYFQGWGWPRFPTREELWAMSYLSIIHGANGITWYTYGGSGNNHGVTDNPEVWGNICALAGELSKLQEVLVAPPCAQPPVPEVTDGPAQDALGYPSISILLKQHQGKWYLLAANSSKAAVTARFSCAAGKQVSLPQESRRITADARGFTDSFGPYGVHVYTWE